jgi:Ca-activated chloride channel family protein
MFQFGFEKFLWVYLLVPTLVLFLWYAWRFKRRAFEQFGESELMRRLSLTVNQRARLAKVMLVVATVALLVTALARPQFGTRVETVRREGQDIVVALDLSASMLAEDIAPNRLEKAKHAVGTLIAGLDGDRIGLIAFAGEAFVQSPLTVDYGAATLFLNAMSTDLMPVQGTDLAEALRVSIEAFDAGEQQHRILIVITDGEDHEGEIDAAVESANEAGIRIYTVGVGSPDGVPIPEFDNQGRRSGYKRDENGDVVTTRLDEATLEAIARETGGRYLRATPSESELGRLADEIGEMAGREFEARQVTQYEEQFQIFLGFALVLLLAEALVPERRRPRKEWMGRFE